jgi:hypothetical protein
MKRALMVGAAQTVLMGPAGAAVPVSPTGSVDFVCDAPKVVPEVFGQTIIRMDVSYGPSGWWRVVEFLSDGTKVNRGDEFAMVDRSPLISPSFAAWRGASKSNAHMEMSGEVAIHYAHTAYVERLWDRSKPGGKVTNLDGSEYTAAKDLISLTAPCTMVSAPAGWEVDQR